MSSIVADCQRTPSLKGCVVLFPVGSSIAGLAGLTHAASLPLKGQRFMQKCLFKKDLIAKALCYI